MNKLDEIFRTCRPYVDNYMVTRAYAETMRERVDKIQREILAECPIALDYLWKDDGMTEPDPITEPKHVYLGTELHCQDYYAECNARSKRAGIKPKDMDEDHCPALVAENLQIEAENRLIDVSWKAITGEEETGLLWGDKRKEWIDMVSGLVVKHPEYEDVKV